MGRPLLLVSLLVASFGALAGVGLPGAGLAQAIGSKLVCAVRLSGDCPATARRSSSPTAPSSPRL